MIDTDGHTTVLIATPIPPPKDVRVYVDNTPASMWSTPEDATGFKLSGKTIGIAALIAIGFVFLFRR